MGAGDWTYASPMRSKHPKRGDVEERLESRCPWCGEPFEVLADLSAHSQHYVEDCQCCCRPIEVSFLAVDGRVTEAHFERSE